MDQITIKSHITITKIKRHACRWIVIVADGSKVVIWAASVAIGMHL